MLDYRVSFGSPWYLLLLLLVPLLWWFSFGGLAALGRYRRLLALAIRTGVVVLVVLALAEIQWVRISDRLTVIYLLDQSLSIPAEQRRAMIRYTNAAIRKQRQREDRAGVIVFGRDAAIEIPPFDDDVQMTPLVESLLDQDYTNLSSAMRLAQASFPEDAAKRIVIVSDGNENLGDGLKQAQSLAEGGVGIDVVAIRYRRRGEVILDRVAAAGNIRKGRPFDLRVVLTNTAQPTPESDGRVPGKLVVRKQMGDQSVVVSEDDVVLPPGKQVYSIRQQVEEPGFYTYEAVFLPDRPQDDAMRQNNRATTFTHIRGKGQVLLIENYQSVGEYERMAQALRRQDVEVTVRSSDQLFTNLAELQQYDTVVLANVPREHFTDGQIAMLVRNTQQMGAGLVMMGAPNSFGAGGWAHTELEKAMPVDFQIKAAKIIPRGALVMVMHASEMAQGNFWQKKIAEEAMKALGPRDYCGVIRYDNRAATCWLWNPGICTVGGNRNLMLARISRMVPGDMPDFDPGLILAKRGFAALPDAAVKHMIVISDGDPSPPSGGAIKALVGLNVTVSTVAVGTHGPAGSNVLNNLAKKTGGKYYQVRNAKALPKIFQREARRVAQPLVYENPVGFRPRVRFPHEMIRGIQGPLPPITGFVMTTVKENPLVEVALVSPQPGAERNRTLLASWTYGLGRAVVFTTDAGARYADRWTGWADYDKLFGQMLAWSMRPVGDEGEFSVATGVEDGQVRVVVNALDKNEAFLNFLEMSGTVVGPDLEPTELKIEQVAPGRYQGTFPSDAAGSYFVIISPGPGKAPIRTGVNVPYSDEFRGRATNQTLLDQLAGLAPKEGARGKRIGTLDEYGEVEPLLKVNVFRHDLAKATSSQDVWYLVVLAGMVLFFLDVFVRRVQVGLGWVPAVAGRVRDRVLGRPRPATEVQAIQRLRSRKAEVETRVRQLRASTRFEATEESLAAPPDELAEPLSSEAAEAARRPSPAPAEQPPEESYTARLLEAKKKAWKGRKLD